MNKKRDSKTKADNGEDTVANSVTGGDRMDKKSSDPGTSEFAPQEIKTKAHLKAFLNNIRDRITDNGAAPIYAMSAMNHVMTLPAIYDLLDNENKEIARDIWLRIKQSGLQVRMPSLLFSADEIEARASTVS
jgi:hypothetical protein